MTAISTSEPTTIRSPHGFRTKTRARLAEHAWKHLLKSQRIILKRPPRGIIPSAAAPPTPEELAAEASKMAEALLSKIYPESPES